MGSQQDAVYYDAMYARSKVYRGPLEASIYQALYREASLTLEDLRQSAAADRPLCVLDLGCGCGHFAEELMDPVTAELSKPRFAYHGIDFSAEAIALARSRRVGVCTFEVADITAWDVAQFGDFDVVVALEVLEHIEADRALLWKIPSGTPVVFSVPRTNDRSHVRYFQALQDVVSRYCCDLRLQSIRRVGNFWLAVGLARGGEA